MHSPPTHPVEHPLPQAPQLVLVFSGVSQPFVASPSQLPNPVVQVPTAQALSTQAFVVTFGSAHTRLHPKQLFGSLDVLTHAPLHGTRGDAQLALHVLPEQTWPAPHATPGEPASPTPHPRVAPQYRLLVSGSMQPPLQLISVPGHETAHAPELQT